MSSRASIQATIPWMQIAQKHSRDGRLIACMKENQGSIHEEILRGERRPSNPPRRRVQAGMVHWIDIPTFYFIHTRCQDWDTGCLCYQTVNVPLHSLVTDITWMLLARPRIRSTDSVCKTSNSQHVIQIPSRRTDSQKLKPMSTPVESHRYKIREQGINSFLKGGRQSTSPLQNMGSECQQPHE